MSTLGVLVSLYAPTARSAYQKLSLVMLAFWFIPMFVINVAPEEMKIQINQFINSINLIQLAVLGLLVVLTITVGLMITAMRRFLRTRLILD